MSEAIRGGVEESRSVAASISLQSGINVRGASRIAIRIAVPYRDPSTTARAFGRDDNLPTESPATRTVPLPTRSQSVVRESIRFPDILESVARTAVPDAIWLKEGAEKRASVQRMFAEIAPTYDRLNGLMSISQHGRWRKIAVQKLQLHSGDTALDVCCGTGDFMVPLRKAVGDSGLVYGVDFCLPMLSLAKEKQTGEVALGDACRLPILSEVFDAVSVGWGIRNVPDIDAAHREIFRVLKAGGQFVSLDMAHPANRLVRWTSNLFSLRLLPILGSLFGNRDAYTYLPKSAERFMSREELNVSMERAGFKNVAWKSLMLGNICIHWGQKP